MRSTAEKRQFDTLGAVTGARRPGIATGGTEIVNFV
jgi:hypothetical protein